MAADALYRNEEDGSEEGDEVVVVVKKKKKNGEEDVNGEEDEEEKPWWSNPKLFAIVIVLAVIVIVWMVSRPTKPRFVLLDATVFALNVSGTNLLTSKFQLTVRCSNPNDHISIFYDRFVVYASFYQQQITLPTTIPTTFQEKNGMNIWSPLVTGLSIPIARFTWATLKQDQMAWNLPILFEIDGWVKWKVQPFPTRSYHIHVNCQAYIPVGNPTAGVTFRNNIIKYQLYQGCTVSD